MPTYAYACVECGHQFDATQSFSDPALTECPRCGGRLRKQFGSVGIVFKGSGFYRTDSRAGSHDAKSNDASAGDKASGDKQGATKSAGTSTSAESGTSSNGKAGSAASSAGSSAGNAQGGAGKGTGSSSGTTGTKAAAS